MQIAGYPSGVRPTMEGQSSLTATSSDSASGFGAELKAELHNVDHLQKQAETAMQDGAVHGANHIHESMIKLEEADISLRLLVKVRDKAMNAYQEVMRMQF